MAGRSLTAGSMLGRGAAGRRWTADLLGVALVCLVFIVASTHQLDTPGLYMDAVNPDYIAVRALYGSNADAWVLPGSLLFDKFPLLVQIYHGALPYWVGLPVYAVFGTGVHGVRFANVVFGLLVLLACFAALRRFGVGPAIATAVMVALALDPGFLFTFRVQFYITTLPLACVLASVALTEHGIGSGRSGRPVLAGLLAGLSVYGYFIYAFLLPTVALMAWTAMRREPDRVRRFAAWVFGAAAGLSLYAIGYTLMVRALGGWSETAAFLRSTMGGLAPQSSTMSLASRLSLFQTAVGQSIAAVGQGAMMLQEPVPPTLAGFKAALLVGVPAVGLIASMSETRLRRGLLMVAGLGLGEVALYLLFGDRLWLQHIAWVPPVLYVALGLALCLMWRRRWLRPVGVAVLLALGVGNVLDTQRLFTKLEATGGVGLASYAIEQFAADVGHAPGPALAMLPDWGVFMPFAMITRGRVPYRTEARTEEMRAALCRGWDVVTATIAGREPGRIDDWSAALHAGPPDATTYSQRDGVPVLSVNRWRAARVDRGEACR